MINEKDAWLIISLYFEKIVAGKAEIFGAANP